MASFAKIVKSLARKMRLLDGYGFNENAGTPEQRVTLTQHLSAELGLNHNREFNEVPC